MIGLTKILSQLESLQDELRELTSRRISIPSSQGVRIFRTQDIVRLEADRAYCRIHLKDGSSWLASRPLKEIHKQLSRVLFIRIHTSHVINIDFLTRYKNDEGGHVLLADGSCLPVARRRRKAFLTALQQEM